VGVLDQLRLRRGTGGEVEQQRVVGARRAVRREVGGLGLGVHIGQPAGLRRPDRDPRVLPRYVGELGGVRGAGDDVPGPAPLDPGLQVGRAEQRRGGDQHGAQLHRGEDGLPQLHLVAEHQQQAVAAGHPEPPQPVGHPVGPRGQLGEGQASLGTVLLDDPQRGRVVALGDRVEPVQRPVELVQLGPLEARVRRGVVRAVCQQEVSGRPETGGALGCRHRHTLTTAAPGGYLRRLLRRISCTPTVTVSSATPEGPATQAGHGYTHWPLPARTISHTMRLMPTTPAQMIHRTISAVGRPSTGSRAGDAAGVAAGAGAWCAGTATAAPTIDGGRSSSSRFSSA
jgi:hypothetical protein